MGAPPTLAAPTGLHRLRGSLPGGSCRRVAMLARAAWSNSAGLPAAGRLVPTGHRPLSGHGQGGGRWARPSPAAQAAGGDAAPPPPPPPAPAPLGVASRAGAGGGRAGGGSNDGSSGGGAGPPGTPGGGGGPAGGGGPGAGGGPQPSPWLPSLFLALALAGGIIATRLLAAFVTRAPGGAPPEPPVPVPWPPQAPPEAVPGGPQPAAPEAAVQEAAAGPEAHDLLKPLAHRTVKWVGGGGGGAGGRLPLLP
jgi:hypothetical protein